MAYPGHEPEPPNPAQPPAPPTAGQQAEALTAAQKAGYYGETKESGSDPTRGEKHWDPQWEKRARKILGSEAVGGLGDLYDPEHRKRLNRMLRAQRRGKGKAAAKPVEEAAPTQTPEEATETGAETPKTGLPTAQGSAGQLREKLPGNQIDWEMPGRRVPGEDRGGWEPGRPVEGIRGEPWDTGTEYPGGGPSAAGPGYQTGLWTPEDEARARAADQAGGLDEGFMPGGNMAGGTQQGREDQYVTNAGILPADYPQLPKGGDIKQPTTPWPPPVVQPTFYTGGM